MKLKYSYKDIHDELIQNKKTFALVYSNVLESGFGCDTILLFDNFKEVQENLLKLINKTGNHFHSIDVRIVRSYHIDAVEKF